VVGTLTLPNFGVAFAATAAPLLLERTLRRRLVVGLLASLVVVIAFYSPHVDDLAQSSRQDYAAPILPFWIVTAPIDQTLTAAFAGIDELLLDPDLWSLAVAIGLALILSASPLLRDARTAAVLGTGVAVTIVLTWATRTSVAPRFFSFLLVPMFMLLASGAAAAIARFAVSGRPIVRTLVAVGVIGYAGLAFVDHMDRIARLPREAVREAAEHIRATAPAATPVFTYVPYPHDLEYYLGRPVDAALTPAGAVRVCDQPEPAIFVSQPWVLRPVSIPCLEREGVRHQRFAQYARGGRIDVWLVPPG
jgi:hypothetical protein